MTETELPGAELVTYQNPRLVILLHAWNQTISGLDHVKRLVQTELPDSDIYAPELPITFFSRKDLAELSGEIAHNINQLWQRSYERRNEGWREILFIGHSLGATLARTVFIFGLQGNNPVGIVPKASPMEWTRKVTRIVQFAAFNNGWEVSYLVQGPLALALAPCYWVAYKLRKVFGEHVFLQLYRGSRFISEMRLRWLHLEYRHRKHRQPWPLVIQLLGSTDYLIAPQDAVDLASGQNFIYLDVSFTDHFNIVELYAAPRLKKRRRNVFIQALTEYRDKLFKINELDRPPKPDGAAEDAIFERRRNAFIQALKEDRDRLFTINERERPPKPDDAIEDVVFVIHGIRDSGFWAQHIARTVLDRAQCLGRRKLVRTLTPSYGYYGMGPFFFRTNRLKKVAWFIEQYIEARARYPKAKISYIGHSNGTYLPTRSLEEYPSCGFHHLVLAGSVVRVEFPWDTFTRRPQNGEARVGKVWNFVATNDLVVAGFPRLFDFFPFRLVNDLGGAGHKGFARTKGGALENYHYAPGGHSAALKEQFWNKLGDFILAGFPHDHLLPAEGKQERLAKIVGRFPLIAWSAALLVGLALAVLFAGIAYGLAVIWNGSIDFWFGAATVAFFWAFVTILRSV